jgi:hypothetical protein
MARRAHGATPLQVEIQRDGRSSEAYSFINSAVVGHTGGAEPPMSAPPLLSMPPPSLSNDANADSAQTPPPMGSASAVGTAGDAVAAIVKEASRAPAPVGAFGANAVNAGAAGTGVNGSMEPKPGEVGYKPAPKTFEIAPK